jgi:P27 family predicted phage terminase small subunit
MRGRKPEPSALKILRGLPGKRKLSVDEPQPTPLTNAEPPDWLNPEAQAEWRRQAPMLERLGVLTESDTDALTAYCVAWTAWKQATQQIWKFGMVIKGRHDVPMQSPYVKLANTSMAQMCKLLIEFGMTPSSRTKVHAAKKPDTPVVSKWAGLK